MNGRRTGADAGVHLWYGQRGIQVVLPDWCRIHTIRKRRAAPLQDPEGEVRRALRCPVEMAPLREIARGRRDACILICDVTRPVPNGILLPPVVEELEAAGIPRERMTILIATGLHRPAPEQEKRLLVGDDRVYRSVRVENHRAEDDGAHVFLGTTSRGTPVRLDRRFVDAQVRVVTGLIEPHFMAGYSGGRKVVAPGVAHRDTILAIHSPEFMEHPRATSCVLDGNPLHQDQLEILGMVGEAFAVNAVVDEDRRPVFLSAGDVERSHGLAVAEARRISEVPVGRRFHTILTSAGGFPLDKTYYQTVKGMVTPLDILEPGGTVIVVSECSEGIGSNAFVAAQDVLRERGAEGFLRWIRRPGARTAVDQWQTEKLAQALCRGRVELYAPGLSRGDWGRVCVERCADPAASVARSVARRADRHVAVIPEGPYVIPTVGDAGDRPGA
ncbi:MAG: nickel-dependent lactate racemase [Deferrisomatales bacterium]